MRFRGKSIRRKIVALLLVPLVSLTAVWGFAAVLTGREVTHMFQVSAIVKDLDYPTEDAVRALQQERRQTLVYLADPRASDALTALNRTRAATDRAVAELRRNAKEQHVRDGLDPDDRDRLTAELDGLDGIQPLRRSVEQGTVDRAEALGLYNAVVDPCYTLLGALDGIDDVEMDKQARALVNINRARELVSREDALLGSALVVGKISREETREISALIAQRTLLYGISLPLLPAAERDRFDRFWTSATSAPLLAAEKSVVGRGSGMPNDVSAKSWDTTAGNVLSDLRTLDDQVSDRLQDRSRPVAVDVIVQAAVVGVLGLVVVLFSLVVSVRVGRGLIRDLRLLRTDAHDASGVRLPSVMRRLSAGEKVDVETEVPRLEYDKNEIGEVGQALNTLQRAAVEAAVKQAELRAGVSEVFVNLARRSQVLLHKQLTLLDTMERRTEDTDELADLFRLDHLTTRMRRHAEGLVILSGAAPSRQWRRPVQLMDVVRAAVAEVEDYERVEVRRLPRIAVTGPAVADLTHLVAELLENATVFSPPHTAVQVLGERVANGFTLEIHDRGLGMAAEALLEANLKLAETPEFELSDTDRLGLFVISRLAQRQNVRVSLQPSPYGGTTAVVFIPDVLLTDDVPDTNGIGFRLDRGRAARQTGPEESRAASPAQVRGERPGLPAALLDGPVELEAPVDLDALDEFPGALTDEDSERGGLFHPRRSLARADEAGTPAVTELHQQARESAGGFGDEHPGGPVPLPARRTPKLVSSHGKPVTEQRLRRVDPDERDRADQGGPEPGGLAPLPSRRRTDPSSHRAIGSADRVEQRTAPQADGPDDPSGPSALPQRTRRSATGSGSGTDDSVPPLGSAPPEAASGTRPLPRRVRQANLAPQLRQESTSPAAREPDPAERDADEVRSRMASLQRGWQRGRAENAEGDGSRNSTAQGTTKGDGR